MDPGRIQAIIAAVTLFAALVSVYATLTAQISSLEARVMVLEDAQREDRAILTREMVELMKMVHQIRGELSPRVATDQRGPR